MLYPVKIRATKEMLFMIVGANYQNITIENGVTITKNCVYKLSKEQTLIFSGVKSGFKTLVFAIESTARDSDFLGRVRSKKDGDFIENLYSDRLIRVIKGPEYNVLTDDSFFAQDWTISQNSSQMGLILKGMELARKELEMISQPVTDGTVQLSPNGPIVLMRHRQTVGGYPRIANVIESDISKLAQFALGETFKFKLVSLESALKLRAMLL
jgi:allophanate hydrolase subunit 2